MIAQAWTEKRHSRLDKGEEKRISNLFEVEIGENCKRFKLSHNREANF